MATRRRALSVVFALATAVHTQSGARVQAQRPAPQPASGVPESLAQERARRITNLRYALSIRVPETRAERVTGRAHIDFSLSDATMPLALDFEPGGHPVATVVSVNGINAEVPLANGHLMLPAAALRHGANRVIIDFEAGETPLNRNDDFLYTIFVPARAHEAFPVFDQPDLKARWSLSLDVPAGWQALGNGVETARSSANGRTHVSFAETAPLPTYLFAFAAGKFSIESAERNGRVFRFFHRETDAAKVARNRDALFDLHAAALAWMERYTGIPYPFGKFDFLLVPAFQFGGMEHPGAVFYNAANMLLDESATQNQELERASTIAHETAHMWFGDLVTMTWFSDVWMKEVFANFFAAKIVNPSFPMLNHELRFLHAYYPAAYDVDRTEGTNAIRQPLDNLKNAGTLYGAVIYQKAPIVMRQLETLVGPDAFQAGLREYLSRYSFANASWPDLIAILDAKSDDNLAAWSRAWVEERGRPIVRSALNVSEGHIQSLTLTQQDPFSRRGLTWTQGVQVALGYPDGVRILPVTIAGARTDVASARGLRTPQFVLINGRGVAYGDLHIDPASLEWLSIHTPEIDDALTRGSAWLTLWDAVLNGELPASRFLDLSLAALPRETDELNVQRILSYLRRTFWTFTAPGDRAARAGEIEHVLRDRLAAAATVSLRSSYFSALRDVATTPDTLAWLARVWRREEQIAGLPLAENDFIVLAEELAVRNIPGARAIVEEQIARTMNPDRKARLQFVAPALSSDAAERERFFVSLKDAQNRRREPWVLDGLLYLHHPLRAAVSITYIQPSLELLREIQQTGDIFFPKRWMDNTLWGYRSREAAQLVRQFVARAGASYPERLRMTILSAADDLFRAARLQPPPASTPSRRAFAGARKSRGA